MHMWAWHCCCAEHTTCRILPISAFHFSFQFQFSVSAFHFSFQFPPFPLAPPRVQLTMAPCMSVLNVLVVLIQIQYTLIAGLRHAHLPSICHLQHEKWVGYISLPIPCNQYFIADKGSATSAFIGIIMKANSYQNALKPHLE